MTWSLNGTEARGDLALIHLPRCFYCVNQAWLASRQELIFHFQVQPKYFQLTIIFTVVSLVTWPVNGSKAGSDLVLMQTSLLLLCKSSCSYMYAYQFAFTRQKQTGLYQRKVTSSGQVTNHTTVK